MLNYAELDCISNFTFLQGAFHPHELIERAAELGYQALALCDECSLSGIVRAYQAAKQHHIQFIVGSRFISRCETEYLIFPRHQVGYQQLCELISWCRLRAPKGQYQFCVDDILHPPASKRHLRGLTGCLIIVKPAYGTTAATLEETLLRLQSQMPKRLWLGLALSHYHDDRSHRKTLQSVAQRLALPVAALGHVQMHKRSRQPLHDILTAIRHKTPLARCGYALMPNAEHHLRHRLQLAQLYPQQALEQTLLIARQCQFQLSELRYEYPDETVPATMTAQHYLRQETWQGAHQRYPQGIPEHVVKQIQQELDIISDLQYEGYFLTVYDIVRFARSRGILCQGRGSAANSAICYCLGITEVDPESGNLLFARFISQERNEPPDIDIDFEHDRREEVIQYIYQKYGRNHAALTAVVIQYRLRSALRDVGKALAIDAALIDAVCPLARHRPDATALLALMQEKDTTKSHNPLVLQQWASLAWMLQRFPRHLSQHPGGFVIARQALHHLVPLENAAMEQRTIVQWDKDDLDIMGMLKIDILGLGILGVLRRCLEMLSAYHGRPVTLQDIRPHDEATFAMIQRTDTVGVFQIESRAQMSMLPRLKPQTFYDLVIQIAIVRPGPIQGGIVHPYLQRRQHWENPPIPAESPTQAALRTVLDRTLGVVIFQEQAMQVAMIAAGFTANEADALRRSMAAWHRHGSLDHFKERLVSGMRQRGYSQDFALRLYRQLEGFGSYGFPESHAASFARLAWCSAWFKCHYPEIYLTALLNAQPMGFYSPGQLIQDARRHGVAVSAIDVLYSHWESQVCYDPQGKCHVQLGFNRLKGLSAKVAHQIIEHRQQKKSLTIDTLRQHTKLSSKDMKLLAKAGALQSLQKTRRQALWQSSQPISRDLLRLAPLSEPTPLLRKMPEALKTLIDYQVTGFTLGTHPLAFLRVKLTRYRFVAAKVLQSHYIDWQPARACGLVTIRQRPMTAKGTVFLTLEDETGTINVIVPATIALKQQETLIEAKLIGIYGVWLSQDNVQQLKANRLVDLSHWLGSLPTRSRDFH